MFALLLHAILGSTPVSAHADHNCEMRLNNPAPAELGLVLADVDDRVTRVVDETVAVATEFGVARAAGSTARLDRATERSFAMFGRVIADEVAVLTNVLDVISLHTRVVDAEIAARRTLLSGFRPASGNESLWEGVRHFISLAIAFDPQNLIRAVRVDPAALHSPAVQLALQKMVFGGVALAARQLIWLNAHPFGWGFEEQENDWRYFVDAEPCDIRASELGGRLRTCEVLLREMMRELLRNAARATATRHGRESAGTRPIARVERADGRIVFSLEDFGSPEGYARARGTGVSQFSVDGVGIGRLRAHVMATFLGYTLRRVTKPDGSGSIMEISIPESHLAKSDGFTDRSAGAR